MSDSDRDVPIPHSKEQSSSTALKTTAIAVIGSIVVAALTTYGTIHASSGGIQENATRLDSLNKKADQLTKKELPVGTVVASLLDSKEFPSEVGDPATYDVKASKWTLADGKSVSGTRWAELRGDAPVPNLCGMFLRGKSNGKRSGVEEIELGKEQSDSVDQHQHNVRVLADPKIANSTTGGMV